MTNCLLIIGSIRGLVAAYAFPITFLACIVVIPAVVALAVLPYVLNPAEDFEEEANDDGNTTSTMMSTREWLAQRYVPCALEAAIVESIPLVKFTRESVHEPPAAAAASSSCVVCLTVFQEGEELKVLPPCQHAFHPPCIVPWFATNSTCPICRSEVTTTSAEAEAGENEGLFPSSPKAGRKGELCTSLRGLRSVPLIEIVVD